MHYPNLFKLSHRLLGRDYVYTLSSAFYGIKHNLSLCKSKESVVGTDSNVGTGMNLGSSLSYEDVTCDNVLATELLNAKTLGFAVTAVLSGTNTFFMCKKL